MSRGRIGQEEAPKFTQPLKSVSVKDGQTATLQAVVLGKPEPTIKWFKDDKEIKSSPKYNIGFSRGSCTLKISKTTTKDEGSYKCTAENRLGNAMCSATLQIQGAAQPQDAKPPPQAQDAKPPPVQDAKPAQTTPPPPQQEVQPPPPQPKQQQQQVKPPPQEVTIEVKPIVQTEAAPPPPPPPAVTSAPVFSKPLSNKQVKEGEAVRLECVVRADPEADIKWYREGALIQSSIDFEINYKNGVCSLSIPEIYFDDAGKFACTASNSAGTKSTSCVIQVQPTQRTQTNAVNGTVEQDEVFDKPSGPVGPPEFTKPLLPARFIEGARCRFICQIKGNPSPKVTWLRHGKPVDTGYRFICKHDPNTGFATLDITMLLTEDKGEYTCIAKSKAGQVFCTAPLLMPGPFDVWAKEYAEQQAIQKSKAKKDVVNKELEIKVQQKGGKITPSQASYIDLDQEPKLSPFERRLMKEVERREKEEGPHRPPAHDQDVKISPFESRLEKEIKFRERKTSTDQDSTDMAPFDVAAFEASLLEAKPGEGGGMEAETETELESEMETEASQQRAPRFVKEMKNVKVAEGGRVSLSCRVEGKPKPSIQWFKNGRPLQKSTRYDLSYTEGFSQFNIDLVLEDDTGAYTVFAWNQYGKAVNTGRILVDAAGHKGVEPQHMKGVMAARVRMETEEYNIPEREKNVGEVREKHYRPLFKVIPSDLFVKEGKMARFNCRVAGRPPPDLQWYLNDVPVRPDANHRVLVNEGGEHAFMISHCRPGDSGVYTCEATNRAGHAKFTVSLNVEPKQTHVAPSFIDRIDNVTVSEGESAILTCKVTGSPMPKVNWQKDQKHVTPNSPGYRMEMNEDGVCQLFIERLTRHDSAWYTCTAHNVAGRVSCRSRVQVVYEKMKRGNEPAPIFTRRPTQSKRPLPPPEKEEIPSYVTKTFTDEVEASGKATQRPEFVVPINSCDKKEGASAHFACRLQPASDATMRVDWFKNKTPLFIGSRVQTKYEFGICSLDIKGVYPEDAGTITCRATNKYGSAETSGTLTCRAQQSLILETQLPEEMRGIEKTLQFDEYLQGDLPDDSSFPSAEVAAPELVTVPEPVSVLEGETARFSCRVNGVPPPRISWFRDDLLIMGQGGRMKAWFDGIHYMEITKSRPTDSGVIRFVARNKEGMVEFKTRLDVQPKEVSQPQLKPTPKEEKVYQPKQRAPGLQKTPGRPQQIDQSTFEAPQFMVSPPPSSSGATGEPIRVSCRVSGRPSPKVMWFKDGRLLSSVPRMKILQDGNIHTLLILEARYEDRGQYKVEIHSQAGKAAHAFRIDVAGPPEQEEQMGQLAHLEPQEAPVTAPVFHSVLADCVVPEGSPVEMACQVVSSPAPMINWYLNGAIIKPSRYFRMSYIDSVARLQIGEVFPEDQGTYTCEAVNSGGRVSCNGILSVQGEWESEDL